MRAIAVTSNFRRHQLFRFTLATLLAVIIAFAATYAHAAEEGDAVLRKEFSAIYSKLLRNPSDVKLTLQYAEVAVKLGDYEAAIPPLERLVMLDPTLYRTKVKLGTFYQKLGSKVVARSYFEDVAKEKNAPAEVVAEAKQHLQKL